MQYRTYSFMWFVLNWNFTTYPIVLYSVTAFWTNLSILLQVYDVSIHLNLRYKLLGLWKEQI